LPFGYGLHLFHPRSQEVLVNVDSICPKCLSLKGVDLKTLPRTKTHFPNAEGRPIKISLIPKPQKASFWLALIIMWVSRTWSSIVIARSGSWC
jgi:hypothetical protein